MVYINEPAEAQKEERTEESESSVNQRVAGLIPQTTTSASRSILGPNPSWQRVWRVKVLSSALSGQ